MKKKGKRKHEGRVQTKEEEKLERRLAHQKKVHWLHSLIVQEWYRRRQSQAKRGGT